MTKYYIEDKLEKEDINRFSHLSNLLDKNPLIEDKIVNPFTGEFTLANNYLSREERLSKVLRQYDGSFGPVPGIAKKWWIEGGNSGFDKEFRVSISDPNFLNYVYYEGPNWRLSNKLFVLVETTKGKYSFIKDINSGELYSVEKRFLVSPSKFIVGPTNDKSYNTSSWSGNYRNKRGELVTKGFKVLRNKEPLGTSGDDTQDKVISVFRVKSGRD